MCDRISIHKFRGRNCRKIADNSLVTDKSSCWEEIYGKDSRHRTSGFRDSHHKRHLLYRQDQFHQRMVGKRGQRDPDCPPPALWQDAEHEHGGEVLLHRFCGERGTVRRPCHLAGKIPGWGLQVQAPSGNLPCRQPFFCKGESGHVPGHQKADLPDYHGTVQ